jgi:dTDP-4-amino-4,6-dideoxygalactose transaminase
MTIESATLQQVPFFDYAHQYASERIELLRIIDHVAARGAFIMQAELFDFEKQLASYVGVKHALGVGNATDALIIACRAAGVGPGDEVILSSHTMIATAVGVHFSGGTPVPVDCGSDHLIDPDAVRRAITSRTRAILPTQLNGRTCDMDSLEAIAGEHGLAIIEDAAQALGSQFKGRSAGAFGIASAISFYPAKVLGCLGDGGAILTSDDTMYERMAQLRDFGRDGRGNIVSWGFNTRLDNLQAAILGMRLTKHGDVIDRRRAIAAKYHRRLSDLKDLVLPPCPDADSKHFDIYQNYEIEAENRDLLKAYLAENGIGTLVQWGGQAIHQLRSLGFTQTLPYTDHLFSRMLMLPLNMSISDEKVEYVCSTVRRFYGKQ